MNPYAHLPPSGRARSVRWPWRTKPATRPRRATTPVLTRLRNWSVAALLLARSLTAACLMNFIAACATTQPVQTKTVTKVILPPRELVEQRAVPVLSGQDARDVVAVWMKTKRELEKCNGRAAGLAQWMAEHPEGEPDLP